MTEEQKKASTGRLGVQLLSEDKIPTYLHCAICKEIVVDPVELLCCHTLACEDCVDARAANCENCGNPVSYKEAVIPRRMVGEQKAKCAFGCGLVSTFSEVRVHAPKCPERVYECSAAADCKFAGKKSAFVEHLKTAHMKTLMAATGRPKDEEEEGNKCAGLLFSDKKNCKGNLARIGETGKYYCGKPMESKCECCDGNCGPNNGCNCGACMKLDVDMWKLPEGFLVNREGVVSQFQPGSKKYSCGKKIMSGLDRRCTPSKLCSGCASLNSSLVRYQASVGEVGKTRGRCTHV